MRFDNNEYSVMASAVGRPVEVRACADRIELRQDGRIVGQHPRVFGRGRTVYDPWHYVPVLARKPGALRNGAPFQDWVLPGAPERVRRKLKAVPDGDRQMVDVLGAVLTDGLPAVEAASAEALKEGVHPADVILNILSRRRDPGPSATIRIPCRLTDPDAMSPVMVRSPSGGRHIFFGYDSDRGDSIGKIGKSEALALGFDGSGLDTKGHERGSYVIAPGSFKDSGRYEPMGEALGSVELPAYPAALRPPRPAKGDGPVAPETEVSEGQRESALARLEAAVRTSAATPKGERDRAVYNTARLAGGIGAHGAEGDRIIMKGDAWDLFREACFAAYELKPRERQHMEKASRVWREWLLSDQRAFEVRCPHCGEYSEIQWSAITWQPDRPETAFWACGANGCAVHEGAEKGRAVEGGRWRATRPEVVGHHGFRMNALSSLLPAAAWPLLAAEFLEAKKTPETLKVFVNTLLGEPWREDDSGIS